MWFFLYFPASIVGYAKAVKKKKNTNKRIDNLGRIVTVLLPVYFLVKRRMYLHSFHICVTVFNSVQKTVITICVQWMLLKSEPPFYFHTFIFIQTQCFHIHTISKATSVSTANYWMLGQSTGVRSYTHGPCFPFFHTCSTATRNGLCVNTECILHRKPFNLKCVLFLTSAAGYSWGNWTCIIIMKTCGVIIEQMNPSAVLHD